MWCEICPEACTSDRSTPNKHDYSDCPADAVTHRLCHDWGYQDAARRLTRYIIDTHDRWNNEHLSCSERSGKHLMSLRLLDTSISPGHVSNSMFRGIICHAGSASFFERAVYTNSPGRVDVAHTLLRQSYLDGCEDHMLTPINLWRHSS